MDAGLRGKTVLVTGASGGLGRKWCGSFGTRRTDGAVLEESDPRVAVVASRLVEDEPPYRNVEVAVAIIVAEI